MSMPTQTFWRKRASCKPEGTPFRSVRTLPGCRTKPLAAASAPRAATRRSMKERGRMRAGSDVRTYLIYLADLRLLMHKTLLALVHKPGKIVPQWDHSTHFCMISVFARVYQDLFLCVYFVFSKKKETTRTRSPLRPPLSRTSLDVILLPAHQHQGAAMLSPHPRDAAWRGR